MIFNEQKRANRGLFDNKNTDNSIIMIPGEYR